MAARSHFLAVVLSAVIAIGTLAPAAAGQEQTQLQPQVDNSKYQFAALINANTVLVRSGPGDNYYPTMRLDKGVPVTVVGIKFDWLKIVPPEGSFSVAAKTFLDKQADGMTGKVNADSLNVRAGSTLNQLKVTVQCKLKKGDVVTIVGEEDAYYHIKPPPDAYLYVHQKFADPLRQITPLAKGSNASTDAAGNEAADSPVANVEPTTRPAKQTEIVIAPTTRPTNDAAAENEFDRLEAELKTALGKSLDQQPVEELLAGYEKLLNSDHLPVSMRRMSELRLASLRVKNDAKQELLATQKQQAEAQGRLATIREERQAIEQRLVGQVELYTAVGTLQASSLQLGAQTIYRLTDPATGRTLCYVRSNDPKYARTLGQFIGVKGELVNDPQLNLKVVMATDFAAVDPARVNKSVTAQVVPPSMMTAAKPGETASTDDN